ncbi:hypothetical protein AX15_000558 [Amanita polypyramis BW_CC]|nr:hypothetical protein AX15_000558 [Amanita polypyramis BW_CC]
MPVAPCRERRSWTVKEDQLLRDAVEKEDPHNPNPSKWHAIAKHVPNRTNKDCRKRWFAKMASDCVKGGWSPEEDERLVRGIKMFGTRWVSDIIERPVIVADPRTDGLKSPPLCKLVTVTVCRHQHLSGLSAYFLTECAKRWTDTLNPSIDRSMWTPEADDLLLKAVTEHGKVWTKIVKTYFPGRTGLSAKNRYNSITRFNSDHSRNRVRRKTPDNSNHLMHRKASSPTSSIASSASSSCSATPSPITPSMSISTPVNSSHYQPNIFDSFSGWPTSPTTNSSFNHGLSLQIPSTQNYDVAQQPLLPKSQMMDHSFQTFDNSLNHPFPQYANPPLTFQNDPTFHHMFTSPHQQQPMYPIGQQETTQLYSQPHMTNDLSSQFAMFSSLPTEVDPFMGLTWDGANPQAEIKQNEQNDRFIVPTTNESLFIF